MPDEQRDAQERTEDVEGRRRSEDAETEAHAYRRARPERPDPDDPEARRREAGGEDEGRRREGGGEADEGHGRR